MAVGMRKRVTRVADVARVRAAGVAGRIGTARQHVVELRDEWRDRRRRRNRPSTVLAPVVAEEPELPSTPVSEPLYPAAESEAIDGPHVESVGDPDAEPESVAVGLLARRMQDPEYRSEQRALVYLEHIAPINQLIDTLRGERDEWMPYVAPTYGGVSARVLAVFRDPGPRTRGDTGSGFLSLENDDPSAERHLEFVSGARISPSDLMVWNTYPWYINRKPVTAEIDRGLDPLHRLIELLPELQVVIAHGVVAQAAWKRFERKYPQVAKQFEVIGTYHTSKQALWTPDQDERDRRHAHIVGTYEKVAGMLGR